MTSSLGLILVSAPFGEVRDSEVILSRTGNMDVLSFVGVTSFEIIVHSNVISKVD